MRDKEDERTNHLTSYNKYLVKRQQLYDFYSYVRKGKYKQLYEKRYSLLNHVERQLDWYRTMIVTHADTRLFGSVLNDWFTRAMAHFGAPLVEGSKPGRYIVKSIKAPPFYVDLEDNISDPDADELPGDSATLAPLPPHLRFKPEAHEQILVRSKQTLESMVQTYAYQVRTMRVGRAKTKEDTKKVTPPSDDESSDEEEKGRPCARKDPKCTNKVYGRSIHRYCHRCQDERDKKKEEALARAMPPLMKDSSDESIKSLTPSTSSTTPAAPIPVASTSTPLHASSVMSSSSVVSSSSTSSVKKEAKSEEWSLDAYKGDGDEVIIMTQYERMQEIEKREREAKEKGLVPGDEAADKFDEREGVLGDAFKMVFTPTERASLRRLRVPTALTTRRDIAAEMNNSARRIGKFTGESLKAPGYLKLLCQEIYINRYSYSDASRLFQQTLEGGPTIWHEQNARRTSLLAEKHKPLAALIHMFKEQYLNAQVTRSVQATLMSTRLTNPSPSLIDLDAHLTSYLAQLQILQFCDSKYDEDRARQDYLDSLPATCRSYIGLHFQKANSIAEIHRMAQLSLTPTGNKAASASDVALARTIGLHAITTHNKPSERKSKEKPTPKSRDEKRTTHAHNESNVTCYHCGDKGHFTGRCKMIKAGQPQTTKGALAHAARNKEKGYTYAYDPAYWVNVHELMEKKRQEQTTPNNNQHSNRRRRKQINNKESAEDESSEVIDVDSD